MYQSNEERGKTRTARRHWKKLAAAVLALTVLLVGYIAVPPLFKNKEQHKLNANPPTYVLPFLSVNETLAGHPAVFSCQWTGHLNVSSWSFVTNNSGYFVTTNYSSWSNWITSTSAWANVTMILNPNGNERIQYEWNCNDTDNNWNSTGYKTLTTYAYPSMQPIQNFNLGSNAVDEYGYYSKGPSKDVIYITYLNTSFATWHFQIIAYDVNASIWTGNYDLGDTNATDTHWDSAVGKLPNGSLIYSICYTSLMYYWVTTFDADSDPDRFELISNWNAQVTTDLTGVPGSNRTCQLSYPTLVCFPNSLTWFGRNGSSAIGNYVSFTWNSTSGHFNSAVQWEGGSYTSRYWSFNYFSSGTILTAAYDFGYIYFVYSTDEGITWKNYTGIIVGNLATPINDNYASLGNYSVGSYSLRSRMPLLDENGKVIIPYSLYVGPWFGGGPVNSTDLGVPVSLLTYTAALGDPSGSWLTCNCTDDNGNLILGQTWTTMFLDVYYNLPSFWGMDNGACKVVRVPGTLSIFHVLWTDQTENASLIRNTVPIYCSHGYYDSLLWEEYPDVLGNYTEPYEQNLVQSFNTGTYCYIWGCNYTCTKTDYVDQGTVYISEMRGAYSYEMAVYYADNLSLAFHSDYTQSVSAATTGAWSIETSFGHYQVYSGTNYVIAVVFNTSSYVPMYYYSTGSTVNQTFSYYTGNGTLRGPFTGWPSLLNINLMSFYNRTMALDLLSLHANIRGFGTSQSTPPEESLLSQRHAGFVQTPSLYEVSDSVCPWGFFESVVPYSFSKTGVAKDISLLKRF